MKRDRKPARYKSVSRKKRSKETPKSSEHEALNAMFDSVDLRTEEPPEIQEQESTIHSSAMEPLDTTEVLLRWKERGLAYREAFLSIIVDTLSAIDALSDIETHFREEKVDPAAEYLTESLVSEFTAVVNDRLVRELISKLYEDNPMAGKMLHAHLLALRSAKPSREMLRIKKLLEDTPTDGESNPYGNLGMKRGYGDEK